MKLCVLALLLAAFRPAFLHQLGEAFAACGRKSPASRLAGGGRGDGRLGWATTTSLGSLRFK